MRQALPLLLLASFCLFCNPVAAQVAPVSDPAVYIHVGFDDAAREAIAVGIEASAWQTFKVKRPVAIGKPGAGQPVLKAKLAYKTVGKLKQDYPAGFGTLKKGEMLFRAEIDSGLDKGKVTVWCGLDHRGASYYGWGLLCLEALVDGSARAYSGDMNRSMKTWIINGLVPLPEADQAGLRFPEIVPSESNRYDMSVEYLLNSTAKGLSVYRIFEAPGALRGPDKAAPDGPIDIVRAVRIGTYDYYPMGAISLVFEARDFVSAPVGWIETSRLPAEMVEALDD